MLKEEKSVERVAKCKFRIFLAIAVNASLRLKIYGDIILRVEHNST